MSDENDNIDDDNEDDTPATNEELMSLIKAQAGRINELETDAQTHAGLQEQVTKLQETLGTTTSLTELVDQLKTMNESNPGQTDDDKHASALQKAAESGNMKLFRKLRQESA